MNFLQRPITLLRWQLYLLVLIIALLIGFMHDWKQPRPVPPPPCLADTLGV